MSIEMNVEFSEGLSREDVISSLEENGAIFVIDDNGIRGNFSDSNMYFWYIDQNFVGWRARGYSDSLLAEVDLSSTWTVHARSGFIYVLDSFDRCSSELMCFVESIAKRSKVRFVLSFQYETICALRDHNGLRYLCKF